MLELSIYPVLLFVHVLSAIVLMGSALFAPLARRPVLEARTAADLRAALDLSRQATKWNPLSALVLLASGIYLGSWGWWSQPWFYVAIAAWIADSALAVAVLQRSEQAMAALAGRAADGPVVPEADAMRRSRRWGLTHAAMFASDLAILLVMFLKPPLAGSLALLIVANVVLLGAVSVRQRSMSRPSRETSEAVAAHL